MKKTFQLKTTREIYEPKATLNDSIAGSPHALIRKRLTISIGIRSIFAFLFLPIGDASILYTVLVTELGRMLIYIYIYYYFLKPRHGVNILIERFRKNYMFTRWKYATHAVVWFIVASS